MEMIIRERVLQSIAKIVAAEGIENTTAKKAANLSGISEMSVFREFETKDNLMFQSFDYVERNFSREILSALPILCEERIEYEDRCRLVFTRCWKYLMGNPEQVRFYLRFYHSAYYERYKRERAAAGRQSLIDRIQSQLTELPDDENTRIFLVLLLDTMLDCAVKVGNGEISDSVGTVELVYGFLFHLVEVHKKAAAADDSLKQQIAHE